jgi:hypothetical protein
MSWDWKEVDFDKEIDIDVDVDFDVDVDVDVDKDTDIDVYIDADTDIRGNSAELFLSVEAYGYDTYTQADAVVLTIEDALSSIEVYAVSAVD